MTSMDQEERPDRQAKWSPEDAAWVKKFAKGAGPVVRVVPPLRLAITEADLFAGYGVGVSRG